MHLGDRFISAVFLPFITANSSTHQEKRRWIVEMRLGHTMPAAAGISTADDVGNTKLPPLGAPRVLSSGAQLDTIATPR